MSMSSKKKTSERLAKTPLMRAAARGLETTVRQLLVTDQHTLNIVCENGKTALGFAVAAGHESVADMLIAAGADVNLTLPDELIHDEHRRMNSVPPMVAAAAKGHWSIVRKLIAANANVDAKCGHGLTTLFYAAAAGKLEIIKELVVAGANVVGTLRGRTDAYWHGHALRPHVGRELPSNRSGTPQRGNGNATPHKALVRRYEWRRRASRRAACGKR
jgi:ankyrin repeat protein